MHDHTVLPLALGGVHRLVGALSFPGQPRVTASVGAIAFERAPESVEAALGAADDAMYAAKREGKNRVVVHEAGGS